MFGLFSLLSLSISTVYPIFATYKAVDNYQLTANSVSSGNLNIGGIQVPIFSILKRATGDNLDPSISHQDQLLQYHLLTTQKWLVYWIIYAVFNVFETLLFLKSAIPLYSLSKSILFIWLLFPIVTPKLANDYSAAKLQDDWLAFTQSGCGYCYYSYVKPWLDGEFELLNRVDLSKLSEVLNFLPFIKQTATSFLSSPTRGDSTTSGTTTGVSDLASKIMDNGSFIYINQFFKSETQGPQSSKDTEEEFDFVDKPPRDSKVEADAAAANLVNRKTPSTGEGKKGWIW